MRYEKALEMLKPCPFCGQTPDITTEAHYSDLMVESDDGKACLRIRCPGCQVEMYEHSYAFTAYEDRLVLMVNKWNRRVRT